MNHAMDLERLTLKFQELCNRFSTELFKPGAGGSPVLLNWVGGDDTFASDCEILKKPFTGCCEAEGQWPLKYAREAYKRWRKYCYQPDWLKIKQTREVISFRERLNYEDLSDNDREELRFQSGPGAPWQLPYLCLFSRIASECPHGYYRGVNEKLNTTFDESGNDFRRGDPLWPLLWTSLDGWSAEPETKGGGKGRGRFVVKLQGEPEFVGYPKLQVLLLRPELQVLLRDLCDGDLEPQDISLDAVRLAADRIDSKSPQLSQTLLDNNRLLLLRDLVVAHASRVQGGSEEPVETDSPDLHGADRGSESRLRLCLNLEFEYDKVTLAYLAPHEPTPVVQNDSRGLECGGGDSWVRSSGSSDPKDIRDLKLCGCGPESKITIGRFVWHSQPLRVLVPDGGGRWIESRTVSDKGDVLVLMKSDAVQQQSDIVKNMTVELTDWREGEKLYRVDVARLRVDTDIGTRGAAEPSIFERGIRTDQRRTHYFGFALPVVSALQGSEVVVNGRVLAASERLPPTIAAYTRIDVQVKPGKAMVLHSHIPDAVQSTDTETDVPAGDLLFSFEQQLRDSITIQNQAALLLVQVLAHRPMSRQCALEVYKELSNIYPQGCADDSKLVIRNLIDVGHLEAYERTDRECEFLRASPPTVMVSRYCTQDGRRAGWLIGGHRWSTFEGFRSAGIQWHRDEAAGAIPRRVSAVGSIEALRALASALSARLIGRQPRPEFTSFVRTGEQPTFSPGYPFELTNVIAMNPFAQKNGLSMAVAAGRQDCSRIFGDGGVFAFKCDNEHHFSGWYLGRSHGGTPYGWRKLKVGRECDLERWMVTAEAWRRLADVMDQPEISKPPLVYLRREQMICVPPQLPLPGDIRRWLCSATGMLPGWPSEQSKSEMKIRWLAVDQGAMSLGGDLFAGDCHGFRGQSEDDAKWLADQVGLRCVCV